MESKYRLTKAWERVEYRAGVWIIAKAMMTAGRAPTLVPTLQCVTPCHPQVLNLVQDASQEYDSTAVWLECFI